jgi:Ankyrin repeats (3 copies)
MVELLLHNGADVNAQGGWDDSALEATCEMGHSTTTEILLKHGANPNQESSDYLDLLGYAGQWRFASLLVADTVSRHGPYGSPLQTAARKGHYSIVTLLLEYKADPNQTGGAYGSALAAAVAGRNIQIMKLLLDSGADPNAIGGQYCMALLEAYNSGHEQLVEELLRRYDPLPLVANMREVAMSRGQTRLVQMLGALLD